MNFVSSTGSVPICTYYHLTNSDEVAIVLNNEVTSSKARVIDGHIYIDYDFVHDNLNSRFYWDNNENILLYATTQNLISAQAEQTSYMVTKSSADYGRKIVTINSDTAYIDLDFVKEYSDFKYKHVKDPHRIIITSQWGKYQTATAKKNASLRVRGGIKSPILKKVSSKVDDRGEDAFIAHRSRKVEQHDIVSFFGDGGPFPPFRHRLGRFAAENTIRFHPFVLGE